MQINGPLMAVTMWNLNYCKQQMPLFVGLSLLGFLVHDLGSDFCSAFRRNSTLEQNNWLLQVAGLHGFLGFALWLDFMVSTRFIVFLAPVLCKRHTGLFLCPWSSVPPPPPPAIFPEGVAWWCLWGWFKALQNLVSDFITETDNNRFCCMCGPVGKQNGHMWNFCFFAFGQVNTQKCCFLDFQWDEHEHSLRKKEWSSSLCRSILKWLWTC